MEIVPRLGILPATEPLGPDAVAKPAFLALGKQHVHGERCVVNRSVHIIHLAHSVGLRLAKCL